MELLNVSMARVVWLLDIAELNPRGKSIMSELLEWLKDEFHFEKAPKSVTELDPQTKALSFERGQFQVREEIFVDVSLKIFNDGIIGETYSSTRDSEEFLKDVLETAKREFNLAYRPETVRAKMCTSELFVRSSRSLVTLNPQLSPLAARIRQLLPTKPAVDYETASIALWPVAAPLPNASLAQFRFERKLGGLWSENKYYSSAPLHTDDHLALLNEFENMLVQ